VTKRRAKQIDFEEIAYDIVWAASHEYRRVHRGYAVESGRVTDAYVRKMVLAILKKHFVQEKKS